MLINFWQNIMWNNKGMKELFEYSLFIYFRNHSRIQIPLDQSNNNVFVCIVKPDNNNTTPTPDTRHENNTTE